MGFMFQQWTGLIEDNNKINKMNTELPQISSLHVSIVHIC